MKVKKFYGKTAQEALAAVRLEMGPNAVILETRQTRQGILGVGARCEVLAALDEVSAGNTFGSRLESAMARQVDPSPEPGVSKAEVRERSTSSAAAVAAVLLYHGVDPQIAFEIADRTAGSNVREGLTLAVDDLLLRSTKPNYAKGTVVCLVGPTGSGKTTTAAKIAAAARLKRKLRVLWIAADTFRVGGVDQAATYADIMKIPLEVCSTSQEIAQAVARRSDAEYVIIDTTGRNHLNDEQVAAIAEITRRARPNEIHLTIPASSGWPETQEMLKGFAPTGYNRLIVTKVDEATRAGTIINLAALATVPISYFTTGQVVPDDISTPDPALLRSLLERRPVR